MVLAMVLGFEITISLFDAIMSAVLVLAYEVALGALIIMMFRLLRRGDRHDRKQRALEARLQNLELAVDSQNMLDRGPSIPRMPAAPRMPHLPFGRRHQGNHPGATDDPNRSDSYGDLNYGASDSLPPTPQQLQVERAIRRSQGPERGQPHGDRGARPPSRPVSRPSRHTAPPLAPDNSDAGWDFPPDDSLGGAERARRANLPLTHWTQ